MLERIVHGEVVELRLARPPVNALDPGLVDELARAVRTAPEEGAAALVISGGPGVFTGGLDLPVLAGLDETAALAAFRGFFGLLEALAACRVPVAAAITGHAPAGGTVIAQFADRRVAAAGEFRLGLVEAQVGIAMPESILEVIRLRVGWARATELAVSGRTVGPEEALELGLVDELAEPEGVVPAALAWLGRLLALPRGPMLETRRRARRPLVEAVAGRAQAEAAAFLEWWRHPDARAAVGAAVARLTGRD